MDKAPTSSTHKEFIPPRPSTSNNENSRTQSSTILNPLTSSYKKRTLFVNSLHQLEKPKKPLSGYNIFYQQERKRILEEKGYVANNDVNQDSDVELYPASDLNDNAQKAKKKRGRPRGKNYKKKSPHRKIGFEELTKCIAKRWKSRKEEYTRLYCLVVEADKKRYKEEMIEYNRKKKNIQAHRHDVPVHRGEVPSSHETLHEQGYVDAETLPEIEPLSVFNNTDISNVTNYFQMYPVQCSWPHNNGSNQESMTGPATFCNCEESLLNSNPFYTRCVLGQLLFIIFTH